MAKLIKILVASVGGGIVLGAGIRLGEAIAAQLPASSLGAGEKLAERLGELVDRQWRSLLAKPWAVAARTERDCETGREKLRRGVHIRTLKASWNTVCAWNGSSPMSALTPRRLRT